MSIPKDFVCKAFHYCWLDCRHCMVIKLASQDELRAAREAKQAYRIKWRFK